MPPAPLPPDDHTHSEWSWDAYAGSMAGSCARAAELGLPSIAFTEHVDAARWIVPRRQRSWVAGTGTEVEPDGRFTPPPLDVEGYLDELERCRSRYPDLRILSGVELGEPHWFAEHASGLLASGTFERILGSLHTVTIDGQPWLTNHLIGRDAPAGLTQEAALRAYLDEAGRMVASLPDEVQVLAHIDYPVRQWHGTFDPSAFEEEFRAVLEPLAASGRALEVNTRVPLAAEVVSWWRDVGGEAVTFASDAHVPEAVASGFAQAAAMVEALGFRADRHPHGFWHR